MRKTAAFTAADVSLAREMHILIEQAPAPAAEWTPAAIDRALADVCGPRNAALAALARETEERRTAIHGLRSHNNGLVADLAIARAANTQLAREREALWLEVARLSRPWWRRVWEWAAEFVAVVVRARG